MTSDSEPAKDYDSLLKTHKLMERENEELLQKLFESERSNKTFQLLIQELEAEIEILHKNSPVADTAVADPKSGENLFLKNQVEELNRELAEKVNALDEITTNLKVMKSEKEELSILYNNLRSEHMECSKNISTLDSNNQDLSEKINLLTESLDKIAVSSETYTERIKCLENDLTETREAFASTKDLLKTTKDQLQECLDEKALLSNELMSLKSQSTALERGNSLFSEVDNQRELVTHQFKVLKEKYARAKRELLKCQSELTNIRNDKLKLLKLNDYEKDRHYDNLLKRYENCLARNKDLERTNAILSKRPECPKIEVIDKACSNFVSIQAMIEDARAESRKLREELESVSSKRFLESEKVWNTENEMSKLRKQLAEYEIQIEILSQQKNAVSFVEEEQPTLREHQHPRASVRFADDVKENDGGKKLVKNPTKQPSPEIFISHNSQPLKENNSNIG